MRSDNTTWSATQLMRHGDPCVRAAVGGVPAGSVAMAREASVHASGGRSALKHSGPICGRSWRPGLTLERIDNDGHYKPGNCRWATREEQTRNTRRAILVDTPKGRLPLKQAARAYGINYETFRRHYHQGVPHKKAAPA